MSQEPFARQTSNGAIRPYYHEPPSQSEDCSTNRDPTNQAGQSQHPPPSHQPIQEDDEYEEEESEREPIRDDFDADQIRRHAGIRPKAASQIRSTDQPPQSSNQGIKDLVKTAY